MKENRKTLSLGHRGLKVENGPLDLASAFQQLEIVDLLLNLQALSSGLKYLRYCSSSKSKPLRFSKGSKTATLLSLLTKDTLLGT